MGEVENGYTFRMGDHEVTMRDSFSSMLDDRQLTDCILVCPQTQQNKTNESNETHENTPNNALTNGHNSTPQKSPSRAQTSKNDNQNRIIRTHRVILSASSDFFRSIFSSVSNLNTGVIAVIVSNVEFEDLDSIVEFIYKGQVSVGQSRIHKFLAAAQLLMVKGLMNIKLVSNDNQPIDENASSDQEVNRLRNEKRLLEQELKALKESDKSQTDRCKRDLEEELKKKLDLERSVLTESKKRFEAEKMKFSIEKEVFEKTKAKDNQNKSQPEQQNQNESTDSSAAETNRDETNANEIRLNRESPSKTGQTSRTLGAQQTPQIQKPSDSSAKKVINCLESPNETEGRQLRKRIKTNDEKTPRSGDISKIEDDEDGEIYEVDFSNLVPQQSQDSSVGEARQRFSEALVSGNTNDTSSTNNGNSASSQSSRAIAAATLAFHASQPTPSQLNKTRTLRRSTSSHGSASTQSMSGENGNDHGVVDPMARRPKGTPGRTPNWLKEQENSEASEASPETRGRKQRVSQDFGQRQDSGLYSCPYCPQVYHANHSMQDHINGVHLKQQQQYICDYCGKVYTWRISLNKHLKTVHPNEQLME